MERPSWQQPSARRGSFQPWRAWKGSFQPCTRVHQHQPNEMPVTNAPLGRRIQQWQHTPAKPVEINPRPPSHGEATRGGWRRTLQRTSWSPPLIDLTKDD
jgi:hypothetical protein